MLQAHFRHRHLIKITYQTAVGVRGEEVIIYLAEVCRITPGQVYKKKLSGQDTTTMLLTSTVRPDKRISDIKRAVNDDLVGFLYSFQTICHADRNFELDSRLPFFAVHAGRRDGGGHGADAGSSYIQPTFK